MIDNKALNELLRQKTIACGLCSQWQSEWNEDWDLDRMATRFYRGIDFFLEKRFLTISEIKDMFDQKWLRDNGILADDDYSLLNPENAILLGNSKSTVRLNGSNAANVYVTDNSWAKVIVKDRAFVIVHVLGKAQVDIKRYGRASCTVILHSEEAVIDADDSVKVKYEFDYLR